MRSEDRSRQVAEEARILPKLGVLDFHPIQYHVPLYRRLAERANLDIDVLYLSDRGHRPAFDAEFGISLSWDIDLVAGYRHGFLSGPGLFGRVSDLNRWLVAHDMIVIHGYSDLWMLSAVLMCRSHGIPYLLRGDSQPRGRATGIRRIMRHIIARAVVSGSGGCLAAGQLNEQFYRQYGARCITFAPYSVDDERFARPPLLNRSEILRRWELRTDLPVIMFCGKISPRKRPLDLMMAAQLLPADAVLLIVGEGMQADQVRVLLKQGMGAVTGFVNQTDLPSYYHAADILVLPSEAEPWGLVVNEAMAAGALPVVSDRVGAAPDLVRGVGEIYRCGDIEGLATALSRALTRVAEPGTRGKMRQHAARFSLSRTAAGFEQAVARIWQDGNRDRLPMVTGQTAGNGG